DVAPRINEERGLRIEADAVAAFGLCHARHVCAVELDAIGMLCDWTVLHACEIDCALRFVHAVNRAHVPTSICDLLVELAVGRVVIDMFETCVVAEPKK